MLIALNKEVAEFHIAKIRERAVKSGVNLEDFPAMSWCSDDLRNGGQIRPHESGWEKSEANKDLLDPIGGKRCADDDGDCDSPSTAIASVASKVHKAGRVESGSSWIDIDNNSDGLKMIKIDIGENNFHLLPRQGHFLRIAVFPMDE